MRVVRAVTRRRGLAACVVAALMVALLMVAGPAQRPVAALEASSPQRYIVELDPTAVSPWLAMVSGDFGEALRVHTVKSRVANAADQLVFDYGALPYVAVEVDDPEALAALDGVMSVKPDLTVRHMLDVSLGVINATSAQLETALSGGRADGTGHTLVIIDDGIDRNHPMFLDETGNSRVVHEACFNRTTCLSGVSGTGTAAHYTGQWHGTHVAGIAAGAQVRTSTRTFHGVARNVDLVAIKVFDENGDGSLIDIFRALEHVKGLITSGLSTISAVNMSLGAGVFATGSSTCDGYYGETTQIIDDLAALDVVTVVAAGNSSQRNALSWPACISHVLPVGASTTTDAVASFSNVSERLADVGLMAPGQSICSAIPDSRIGCFGGTSMAAPHVAGALALITQATQSASAAAQVDIVRVTPTSIVDTRAAVPASGLPAGSVGGLKRLDVSTALATTQLDTGTLTGVVRDATEGGVGTPLASTDLTLSLVPSAGPAITATVTTDGSGGYALTGLPVGIWNVTAAVQGFPTTASQTFTLTAGSAPTASVDITVSVQTGGLEVTASALPAHPAAVTAVLAPVQGTPWATRTVSTTTDADGVVAITGVRPGAWDVTLTSGSYTGAAPGLTVGSGVTTAATVAMSPITGSLELTLTNDLPSVPLSNTQVLVEATPQGAPADRGALVATVTTDPSGEVTLPTLRIGSWRVTVSAAGHDPAATTVVVAQNATTSASLTLPVQLGSVTGNIAFAGGVGVASGPGAVVPLNGVLDGVATTLYFTPSTGNPWSSFTANSTVDSGGGTFNVPEVRPGEWVVSVSAVGYQQVGSSPTVSVAAGGAASIESLAMTAVPHVASISPSSGSTAGGTRVTFTGLHLDDVTSVTFGGLAGSALSTGGGTTLSVTTPARGAGGVVSVVVTSARGTATSSFTYQAPATPSDPGSGSPPPAGGGAGGGGGGGAGGGGSAGGATGSDPAPVTAQVAAPSRPGGSVSVDVELTEGVLGLAFAGVAGGGEVQVQERTGTPPSGTQGLRLLGRYVDISASGVRFDQAELCVPFTADDTEALGVAPSQMRLLHFAGDLGRRDITTRVDTTRRLVCGVTDSFSPFAIGVPATERVAGIDRYTTAVNLSSTFFPDGARTVYVASGVGFADALAAGAAAARAGGPVLLTAPGSLPAAVRAELVRLAPTQVVIVGGASAVAASVDASVRVAVPRATVARVAGNDRYATAVEVSKRTFPNGATTVYVATGLSFPDALAGASAAGRDGAPVLLVPGSTVPSVVAAELARLQPQRVVLLGGSTALGSTVASAVGAAVPGANVTRLQGADRYATAASVAGTFDRGSPVFAATGRTFPDALAGAAVAGGQQGPVIVVPDGVLPTSLTRALGRLAPSRLVVLGGTGALSNSVELQLARFLP